MSVERALLWVWLLVVACAGGGCEDSPLRQHDKDDDAEGQAEKKAASSSAVQEVAPQATATAQASAGAGAKGPPPEAPAPSAAPGKRVAPLRARPTTPSENPFVDAAATVQSSFAVDVDTASYTLMRASLRAGVRPLPSSVRIEEMLNYFRFSYPAPEGKMFGFTCDTGRAPWAPERRLVRIGIKGRELPVLHRPSSHLVFLIDVSGSMLAESKIGLLKDGLAMLTQRLDQRDRVSIVTYAGSTRVVLRAEPGDHHAKIINALDALKVGGATAGSQGIQAAYEVAAEHYVAEGINRVILATDGDFNLGLTSRADLESLIARKAKTGIFLTVLGFGAFNPNDRTMETLADKGNGHYAFVDTAAEAKRVLVEELTSTLAAIAKDVKVQVTWNPTTVKSYRLIGYENRALSSREFHDDEKDGGEIGSGHTVTALYDVEPVSQDNRQKTFGRVAIRYKSTGGFESEVVESPIVASDTAFDQLSTDFRFAGAVAGFGMLLRDSAHKGNLRYEDVERIARGAIGDDADGRRAELAELAAIAAKRFGRGKR